MRHLYFPFAVILGLTFPIAPAIPGDDGARPAAATFDAERFYQDVRQLVRRHYPRATAHRLGNAIHFEHDTRIFLVHEALKTGEWQDPWEERGPQTGGVVGDIEFRSGSYGGQAEVPQVIDKRYFRLLLLAPYAERLDGHLYVHLKLPGLGVPPEGFERQFRALINDFEAYANE